MFSNLLYSKKEDTDTSEKLRSRLTVLENQNRHFKLIQQLTSSMLSTHSLDSVAQKIVDSTNKEFGYQGAILYLVREGKRAIFSCAVSNTLSVRLAKKFLSKPLREYTASLDDKNNETVKVINTGRMIIGSDYPRFISPPVSKFAAKMSVLINRIKTIVALPIKVQGKTVGAIEYILKISQEKVPQADIEMMKIYADQIGIAIENARLYSKVISFNTELKQKVADATVELQNQYNDLQALSKISQTITSTLDLQRISQEIVNSVSTRLKFRAGLLAVISPDKKKLMPIAVSQTESVSKSLKLLHGDFRKLSVDLTNENNLYVQTAKRLKATTSDNLKDFFSPPLNSRIAQKIQKLNQIQGTVAMPLQSKGEVLGILSFSFDKPVSKIDDREKQVMMTLANQAGLAVNNALLFDRLKKFSEELQERVKQATSELTIANKNLRRLDKTKSEFISIASHQLRTPLSAIKGYISMMADGDYGDVSDKIKSILKKVYNSNERLVNLVNNLLNVSRIEGGRVEFNPVPLQIETSIENAIAELKKQADEKKLALIFERSRKELPKVNADERLLHQVIVNLIDNAIKYTQKGKVEIFAKLKGKNIQVDMKDTGVGFEKNEGERLFKKFVRGKDVYKMHTGGSGLGLFIVKKLLEMHGGAVNAQSKGKNQGSTFTFTLPAK
ncbi:MAG: hypothetical protein ACD_63C00228G0003 [uncultured bacterium]|nr:MAG: hypothetical protein ACD_63C00228G0003 [uncultured bacterium]